MDLVVDANVLFSAAIKDSKTAELLLRDDVAYHAPEYVFEEFSNHRAEVVGKTHRTDTEFSRFVEVLRGRIEQWPAATLQSRLSAATEVCPDPDDVPYFALALHLDAPIWSDDATLDNQDVVTVLTTDELVGRLR